MKFTVDNLSNIPVYQQLIDSIVEQMRAGELRQGDMLPSMNSLSDTLSISKETVKKAYNILRTKGHIEASQGKGFYVKGLECRQVKRVLMLFDKLSTYKLILYRSFVESVGETVDVSIHLHNQDIDLFESLLDGNLRSDFDYYIVTPHFPLDVITQNRVIKLLGKIPNRKLILLDKQMSGLPGNYGAVYQDFEQDLYDGLVQGLDSWRRYAKVNVVFTSMSLYAAPFQRSVERFAANYNISCNIIRDFRREDLHKGEAYIVMGGQLPSEFFEILRLTQQQGFALGNDIGVVSYNDSEVNEFILNGLTTMSTDFALMGRLAAEMVSTDRLFKQHNRFSLIMRKTL